MPTYHDIAKVAVAWGTLGTCIGRGDRRFPDKIGLSIYTYIHTYLYIHIFTLYEYIIHNFTCSIIIYIYTCIEKICCEENRFI